MIINFSKIYKIFTTGFTRKRNYAVRGISFDVARGEIFGIIGPNGAGKSTLLKMLMGFLRPDQGKILLNGRNPVDPTSRACVGYLPENPYYYDHLSAVELMKFSAAAAGMSSLEAKNRIEPLLERVNLQASAKRKMRSYSKGMTQRAGLCFALVHDPDILILDEPMSGLDPLGRKMVVDLILDLKNEGKTILFCSHILSDVERLCDRMAIMANGKLHKILHKDDLNTKQDQDNNPLPLESIFLKVIKENAA